MKIYFVSILTFVYSTRYNEEAMISTTRKEIDNYNDYRIICNNLFSYTIVQLANPHSNCIEINKDLLEHNNNDLIRHNYDLLNFLDCVDVQEPTIEELNKCAPVTLDYDSLEELLRDKQDFNPRNGLMKFNDEIKSKSFINKNSFINNFEELVDFQDENNNQVIKDNQNYLKSKKVMWDSLEIYVKKFILKNIPKSHSGTYIRRIDIIKKSYNIFYDLGFNYKEYFDHLKDGEFIEKLEQIVLNFDKSLKFNQETCNKFLKDFDSKIFSSSDYEEIIDKLSQLNDNQTNFIFYFELTNLYRYVRNIPELLVLGGCYSTKSSGNTILIMHIINIFATNVENVRANKVFIVCMVVKALNCFHRNRLALFKIPSFEVVCNKYKHNLFYFAWEFHGKKRHDLTLRKNKLSKCVSNDKRDSKIIVLLYLYQTKILDKYFKIDEEDVKLLKRIIENVKNSKDCIGCLFNKYLDELSKITLNKKRFTNI